MPSSAKSSLNMNEFSEYPSIGCVIMASGLGRRFGGNKLMAMLDGKPLISQILTATDGLFGQRIVVTRHEDIAAFCRRQGVPMLLHALPHRSDTVRLGLENMDAFISGCMFCPGDQPLLRRESIRAMCETHMADPDLMIQLRSKEGPGTPVLFPKRFFQNLMELPKGRGGNVLLKKYPEQIGFVSTPEEYELWDVDSPEDLERIYRFLEQ